MVANYFLPLQFEVLHILKQQAIKSLNQNLILYCKNFSFE